MTQTGDTKTRSFNPNEHMMQLKSKDGMKDYLPVAWRIAWFRDLCPQGTIDTEELAYDLDREIEAEGYVWNNEKKRSEKVTKRAKGYARYRAVVTDGRGGRATGTKSEAAVNFADYGEKAETGAIGRALAALGYGTQFTGDEFDEGERIVDSPLVRTNDYAANQPTISQRILTIRAATDPLARKKYEQAGQVFPEKDWWTQVLNRVFNNKVPQSFSEADVVKLETYKIQLEASLKRETAATA